MEAVCVFVIVFVGVIVTVRVMVFVRVPDTDAVTEGVLDSVAVLLAV